MDRDITHDSAYNTIHRDDFDALIEVDRYADRSDAFDSIISATVDHFWDPQDPPLRRLLAALRHDRGHDHAPGLQPGAPFCGRGPTASPTAKNTGSRSRRP